MQALIEAAKAFLTKSIPSWTMWLGVIWAVLSGIPDVLVTVVGWFGDVTPELTAKVVAVSLMIARLRSLVGPVVLALLGRAEEK